MRSRSMGNAHSQFWVRWGVVALFQTGTIILGSSLASPAQAQISLLRDFNLPTSNLLNQNSNNQIVSACIRLDGRCLFKIADQKSDLPERISDVEQRLNDVAILYLKNNSPLKIRKQKDGNLPNIYLSAGNRDVRLLSVTAPDADLQGVDLETRTDQLIEQIETGLNQAKQERQLPFIIYQGKLAAATLLVMLITSIAFYRWERSSKRSKDLLSPSNLSPTQPISTQLTQQQYWNIKEVQHRLTQLAQMGILGGGSLFILGLFPYSRMFQVLIISSL
jgi:moderate conductance mechanosensitive channel